MDTFEQAKSAIAGAFETTPEAVSFIGVGAHRRAIVEILDSHYLAKVAAEQTARLMDVHVWKHPLFNVAAGTVQVGTLATTGQPMLWQLWLPGQGARHGWVVGTTRGGKSTGMAALLVSACSAGIVVPHVIDLQGGVSLPEWRDKAVSWAEDIPGAVVVLQRVEKLMDARIKWMTAQRPKPLRVVDPSRECPLHLLVIDEAPELLGNREAMRIVDRCARLFGKAGLSVVWITQSGVASRAFGEPGTTLREQLKSGNVWAFYTSGDSTSSVLAGAMGDDGKYYDASSTVVPKGVAGASVIWSPPHPVPSLGRAEWLQDPDDESARWVNVPDVEWPAEPEPEAGSLAEVLPMTTEARTRRDEVRAALLAIPSGRELSLGEVMEILPHVPRASLSASLRALADDRDTILDGGYGVWKRA